MDALANPRAVIGGNNPPPSPYETIKLHIDDLFETATGFLDGEPITTAEQAADVERIRDDALAARKAAEAQRKIEAKPFDEGKAAVQALWTPLTDEKKGRCALIVETCRKALQPFKLAEQAKKDAEAAELRRAAQEKEQAAQAALRAAEQTDLAQRAAAEEMLSEAKKAGAVANKIDRSATGLRTVWSAVITDRRAALNHYIKVDPDAFTDLIQSLADHDARHGPRSAPGVEFKEEKVAR